MDAALAVARVKSIQVALQVLAMLQLTAIYFPGQTTVKDGDGAHYTHIIAGGGSAGCVLASRLSEISHFNVLLIEAGGVPPFESMVPALMGYIPKTPQDWNYTEEYDKNREIYQNNLELPLTQGKMLGGGSSINYMFYVRGNPHDFNSWAEAVKDRSWDYEHVLPYFKKSERMEDPGILTSRYRRFHGTNGYLHVTKQPHEVAKTYTDIFQELGYKILLDVNGDETLGYGEPSYTIAEKVRQSTAYSFLRPVKNRRNLHVLKHTQVTKILFDKSNNAIGVIALTEDGNTIKIISDKGEEKQFVLIFLVPGLSSYVHRSSIDWNYTEKYDRNREIYQNNIVQPLTQGKVLGGGSSINDMYYVRGNPHDFNSWAEAVGDRSWDYEHVLPYFKKSEHMDDPGILASKYRKYHGTRGFLHVTKQPEAAFKNYIDMFHELGYKIIPDSNGYETLGYGEPSFTIAKGVRQSTAYTFLKPVKHRHNLHVLKHTLVTRILFDNFKNAIGVEALTKDRKLIKILADREVIVSCGGINSPKLLLQSGIGPNSHLKLLGINVISDLPVGRNLADHVGALVVYKFKKANNPPNTPDYSKGSSSLTGSIALNDLQASPDYQSICLPIPNDSPGPLTLCSFNFALDYTTCDAISEAGKGRETLLCIQNLLHPKSRGTIKLRSTNPEDPPLVSLRAYSEEEDLETMVEAFERLDKIRNSSFFKSVGGEIVDHKLPKCQGLAFGSKEYWRCHVLSTRTSMYHYAGACGMGRVVDSRLRVRGVGRLRVADSSTMNSLTSGNTNAPVIMIAEKASDMIKEDNGW